MTKVAHALPALSSTATTTTRPALQMALGPQEGPSTTETHQPAPKRVKRTKHENWTPEEVRNFPRTFGGVPAVSTATRLKNVVPAREQLPEPVVENVAGTNERYHFIEFLPWTADSFYSAPYSPINDTNYHDQPHNNIHATLAQEKHASNETDNDNDNGSPDESEYACSMKQTGTIRVRMIARVLCKCVYESTQTGVCVCYSCRDNYRVSVQVSMLHSRGKRSVVECNACSGMVSTDKVGGMLVQADRPSTWLAMCHSCMVEWVDHQPFALQNT